MPFENYTVGIYTLGCKVNQYESEAIAEAFEEKGLVVQSPALSCDVYVINTCTVTAESDRKAKQFIRRAINKNPSAYILVTGCLSQTQPDVVAAIKGVDYVCGNANKLSVIDAAMDLIKKGTKETVPTVSAHAPDAFGFEKMQIQKFDRTRAYIKIQDGCENHCTYCIIPTARGTVRSKEQTDILREISHFTTAGCREIVLTGIETASYGKDFGKHALADLLCEADRIPGVGRIRLGSLDPSLMRKDFVQKISGLSSLAHHFHISMQSGSDKILSLMRRKYNRRIAMDGMERLRSIMPDVQFTTDIIVGFPGETEEDFQETVDFVKAVGFLMVHVFPYSKRTGTVAAQMQDQIPEEIKHRRVALLSQVAAESRQRILADTVGTITDVLFETDSNGTSYGHTSNFIEVACSTENPLQGTLQTVEIIGYNDKHCIGKLL
jgi:threonylcarbamoyladenosine tRNA methylthiotransferase MtaB